MTSGRTGASGLETIAALAEANDSLAPIGDHFNMRLVSFDIGDVVFEAIPDASHYNPIGSVHGGFAATLLDSACGTAVQTSLNPGEGYVSLELKVSFLRRISADSGVLRAHGWVVKPGSRAAFAEADLRDSSDRVLATATSTCAVFPI